MRFSLQSIDKRIQPQFWQNVQQLTMATFFIEKFDGMAIFANSTLSL